MSSLLFVGSLKFPRPLRPVSQAQLSPCEAGGKLRLADRPRGGGAIFRTFRLKSLDKTTSMRYNKTMKQADRNEREVNMKRIEVIKAIECVYGYNDYELFSNRENMGCPLESRKVTLRPETGCDVYFSKARGVYMVAFEEDIEVYDLSEVVFRKWGKWFVRDPQSYKRNNWKSGNDYMLVEVGSWE